jgi:hypothetical protein
MTALGQHEMTHFYPSKGARLPTESACGPDYKHVLYLESSFCQYHYTQAFIHSFWFLKCFESRNKWLKSMAPMILGHSTVHRIGTRDEDVVRF